MNNPEINLKRVFFVMDQLNKYSKSNDLEKVNICLDELSKILDIKLSIVHDIFWSYKNKVFNSLD